MKSMKIMVKLELDDVLVSELNMIKEELKCRTINDVIWKLIRAYRDKNESV